MRPKKAAIALTLLLGLMVTLAACESEHPPKGSGVALMLIDYESDFLEPQGRMPIAQSQADSVIKASNALIEAARKQPLPVIYIRDEFTPWLLVGNFMRDFAAMRYEPGSAFDPRIDSTAGIYFSKTSYSAFANSALDPQLRQLGCSRLAIAGVFADRSVSATARDAMAMGYHVTVISDAVGAASDEARDNALAELKKEGAEVETSAEFLSSLGTSQPKAD